LRAERDRNEREAQKKLLKLQKEKEKKEMEEKKRKEELTSYKSIMVETNMLSNKDLENVSAQEYEEDFM
jgi:hypothetical protein